MSQPASADTGLGKAGLWFLFFGIVYVVLVIKVATGSYLNDSFILAVYSVTITTYIFSRFFLAYLHRGVQVDYAYEPTISFVVPAKNEEGNIAETLRRFGRVEYPLHKIEVIAIDDGSTDQTFPQMLAAKGELEAEHVSRVSVLRWDVNRGKRAGMAEGVRRARHDIVIFVDSDSFVEASCVRHLVKYFTDSQIAAVSGHTDVFNRDTNLLTRMQALRYYVAFTVYKAAESVFGTVTCCPGCCSAYRRSLLVPIIDAWEHQTFLGVECTFGDDRSLTNVMLRTHAAAYSSEAKAYTVVPDTFRQYLRQQQRWKKSWVRETFIAASFIWRKNPFAATFFYAYVFLAMVAPFVFLHAVVWNPGVHRIMPWTYLFGLLLMLMLHGVYYRICTGKQPWIYAVVAFWFYTVILMWQLPWAILTIADTRWGTR